MFEIALCDDNPSVLESIRKTIQDILKEAGQQAYIRTFSSGLSLLFDLDEDINLYDIIFLDIEMGYMNGIETAKELRKKECNSELIFLTDCEEYVFQSFDVMPMHYLLKASLDSQKLKEVLLKAIHLKKTKNEQLFVCEFGEIKKIIPLDDISYFEIQNRIVTVHYGQGQFSFYSTLAMVCEKLHSNNFHRVHRSFIINFKYVDKIYAKSVVMSNGDSIPIGNTYIQKLQETFSNYLLTCY